MGIYMTLLFGLLTVEMATLAILVSPLPLKLRRELFKIYEKTFDSREFMTVMGITETLVALLFVDSAQKIIKLKNGDANYEPLSVRSAVVQTPQSIVKIFYNQRNLYISGAMIFLSIAIVTVFQIIKRLIKYQELKANQQDPKELKHMLENVKKELKTRDAQLVALKAQKRGLERAFDEFSDKVNIPTSGAEKKDA